MKTYPRARGGDPLMTMELLGQWSLIPAHAGVIPP